MSEATEAAEEPSYPHLADVELIAFRADAATGDGQFQLTPALARPDGALYGGTGAAASVMAMEAATQRDALWVVTQFVAQAHVGEIIDVSVEKLALGKRIAQLRVTATVGDRTIFCSLGAAAHPRPGGLTGQFLPMPAVSPPDDCGPMPFGPGSGEGREMAFSRRLEFRMATYADAQPPGSMAIWARLNGVGGLTRAGVAYLADMVPVAISRAAGKIGGGFSLDNSLRFASIPETEWVLLDLRGELATTGYGHGSFTAWSEDGALIATGSQTASMVHLFDPDQMEQWQRSIASAAALRPQR